MAQTRHDVAPPSDQFSEAARMLRAVLDALPPRNASERAVARRIEGAAVALAAVVAERD